MEGSVSLVEAWSVTKEYWIVPAGMLALYYYGWFHFNSPDYALERKSGSGQNTIDLARLISLAPPKFTTSRSRFNRYARRYILVLELTFIAIVFFTGLFNTAGQITKINLPSLAGENLQYRALWGLFFLTGLLSSFPVFKDVDEWLLKKLHQAALIPDDARFTADRLYQAPFVATEEVAKKVRQDLKMRDTMRVAKGEATGTLEIRLLRMLWLRMQLQAIVNDEKYNWFQLKLERDIKDVFNISEAMQGDVRAYFRDQEALVPVGEGDIDGYISDSLEKFERREDKLKPEEKLKRDRLSALDDRRRLLQGKCDALYYRLCLITSLMVFATEFTHQAVRTAFGRIGFQVDVIPRPIVDWNAMFIVAIGVFAFIVGFNVVFALIFYLTGIDFPQFAERSRIFGYSIIETADYALSILAAVLVKKKWPPTVGGGAVNLIIALLGYALAASVDCLMQYFIGGHVDANPLLFALNFGVVSYFVASYIDRSLQNQPLSSRLVAWQAFCQFVATLIGVGLASPPHPLISTAQSTVIAVFGAVEAAVVAVFIGVVFQRLYRRTLPGVHAPVLDGAKRSFGDLFVQPREIGPDDIAASGMLRSYSPPHRPAD
jgi:hypothetical protein